MNAPPPYHQPPGQAPSTFNPAYLLSAGNFLSGGQQYVQSVQKRMEWLSESSLHHQFDISTSYVTKKLTLLLVPFLKRWTFSRTPEQIPGGQRYLPPRLDVYAPDLMIPILLMWTYSTLRLIAMVFKNTYKPDIVWSVVSGAGFAWACHILLLKFMLYSLHVSVPWVDVGAYTGYTFLPACISVLMKWALGSWGFRAAWLYGSLMMAVFMVRSMKRVIYQESHQYGVRDPNFVNYLMLGLAIFQFPFVWWLCWGL